MLDRTISKLQRGESDRSEQFKALSNYLLINSSNASELNRIKRILPSLRLRGEELKAVSIYFPSYNNFSPESYTSEIKIEYKNIDRLETDDLANFLESNIPGVKWMNDPGNETMVLTIEKVRYEEKNMPDKVDTVIYEANQVNIVDAIFSMPRHATFVYDLVTSETLVDYGYVVTSFKYGKKTSDDVIRGKANYSKATCRNAKVQNVFGGVLPANFTANEDMKRRCQSSVEKNSDTIRTEIYKKILDSILKIPDLYGVDK